MMRLITLITMVFMVSSLVTPHSYGESPLSDEDKQLIANLELIQSLEFLEYMGLMKNYDLIKQGDLEKNKSYEKETKL